MDDDATACVLLITKLDQWERFQRPEAYLWVSKLLRSIAAKDDMRFQGELKAVIPIGVSLTGCRYKVVFSDMPEETIDVIIIPGIIENDCTVRKMAKDLQAEDKKNSMRRLEDIRSRVASIGNVSKITSMIDRLSTTHGDGGPENKRQKFAQGAMTVLKTAVAVGSANLEEAQPKE